MYPGCHLTVVLRWLEFLMVTWRCSHDWPGGPKTARECSNPDLETRFGLVTVSSAAMERPPPEPFTDFAYAQLSARPETRVHASRPRL